MRKEKLAKKIKEFLISLPCGLIAIAIALDINSNYIVQIIVIIIAYALIVTPLKYFLKKDLKLVNKVLDSISLFLEPAVRPFIEFRHSITDSMGDKRLLSRGIGYIGMKKEKLEQIGFTEKNLLEQRDEDDKEWLTFEDKKPETLGDKVTYEFEDGRMVNAHRESAKK